MSEVKVDLNQAGIPELAALPKIGEKMAARIVEYREKTPFARVADLASVPGISQRTAGELADLLTVQSGGSPSAAESQKTKGGQGITAAKASGKSRTGGSKKAPNLEPFRQELRAAARGGDVRKVKALMQDEAERPDKFALIWAAQAGHGQVVTELIEAGVDVNSKTASRGTNALALAAQNGHLEVVRALIEAGADVNAPAIEGWTPLMKAAFFGHGAIVRTLLEAGAETRAKDVHNRSAVDYAQRAGNRQIVGLLSR